MNKQGKIWGDTRSLFANANFELHRLFARKGGFCSKHRHASKFNQFYVITGRLRIETWKHDYDLCDVTDLGPGDMAVCKPGEYHRFTDVEDTDALEWYWVELRADDIDRENVGGQSDE